MFQTTTQIWRVKSFDQGEIKHVIETCANPRGLHVSYIASATRWCPSSYISPINHSYWSYVHQLSYRTGAPHCIVVNYKPYMETR